MADPPGDPPSTPPRKNQRRSRRQPPKGSTKVRATRTTMGLGPNIAVSVLDVSEVGVRLVLMENLPQGHEFEITLECLASRSVKTVARVVWSLALTDGNFCVGATFAKALSYSDLANLARS
jgi:PilZ domain